MNRVELKHVTVAFDRAPVFDDLCMTFTPGEKIVLHGETGSGASVFLKTVSGLIEPRSGHVYYNNQPFTYAMDRPFFAQRRTISHLLEDLEPLANLTCFDNVALSYRLNTAIPEPELRGIVIRKLRSVGLEEKADRRPIKLSRDDQIVLCLIMNLKDDCGLMVVDEAFFNLKDSTVARIRDLFLDRMNRTGTTVILRDVDQAVLGIRPTRRITLRRGGILSDEVLV